LLERLGGNQRGPRECGVDIFVDDGRFAHRRAVMHQGRHHAVGIDGEIVRLELIECEQVDVTADPFDALFLHAMRQRTEQTELQK
jgi:hypothetical protein